MKKMTKPPVIIAGAGIGGLTMALTLQQLGVACEVHEAVSEMKPLGVGINIQPNAVRELTELGISEEELDTIGVPALEWALLGLNGKEVYSETRGRGAGYHWPQYAAHRGDFLMLLNQKVVERLGSDSVQLGSRVTQYKALADETVEVSITKKNGSVHKVHGSLLIAADGIHSYVRSQMHPDQGPIHWGGVGR